ncbi:MAG: hypothetical protein KGL10_03575 [Alphaproteobacteria bacterium]|nr:hypothetical protein [Alphaproteobacteria bacterium]
MALFCGAANASAFRAPTAPWVVGPIAAAGTGGTTYCSMKNAYAGGRTLVFARDNQGNNSIAVNFDRNLFRRNHRYGVTARAGHATRRFVALAATPRILVMETGVDTAFYGAVAAGHAVSFAVGRARYGFDLDASVSDGLEALGQCAEALQNGSGFPPATIPLVGHPNRHLSISVAKSGARMKALPLSNRDKMEAQIASQVLRMTSPDQGVGSPAAAPVEAVSEQPVALKHVVAPVQQPVSAVAGVAVTPPAPVASAAIPAAPQPVAKAVPEQSEPAAPAPVAAADNAYLTNLLETAHIASAAQIKASADNGTLHWASDGLFGSAQRLAMPSGASMKAMADSYLRKTAALCTGEYAKNMGGTERIGNAEVLKADITCVSGKSNAAAAVLFVAGQGKFSVITQEGTVDQLTVAMSDRDLIVSAMSGAAKD